MIMFNNHEYLGRTYVSVLFKVTTIADLVHSEGCDILFSFQNLLDITYMQRSESGLKV